MEASLLLAGANLCGTLPQKKNLLRNFKCFSTFFFGTRDADINNRNVRQR